MRVRTASLGAFVAALLAVPASATPEIREEYLSRLRDICEVRCLKPKAFRRAARKVRENRGKDVALIMDVAVVRRNVDRLELFNLDLEDDPLVTQALLGTAGVNTSGSNGIGGLPRGRYGTLSPNVIVVSLDKQILIDLYEKSQPAGQSVSGEEPAAVRTDDNGIVVEGESDRTIDKPPVQALRSVLFNRRIVVRGKPKLTPVFVGGRLDYKNKQVTLMLDSADDLVILPRYDEDGEPIFDGALAGLAPPPVKAQGSK